MPTTRVAVSTPITRSPRVLQVEGMFDIPPSKYAVIAWDVNLPLDERDWHVGLIVGPSGSGKSTVARAVFAEQIAAAERLPGFPGDRSVLDAFPENMTIKDVVTMLSSVGFSSPPAWLRPFHVLSTGEQFRVSLARLLAFAPDIAVFDEFTSVVDRTVARVGSAALAKTVRALSKRFVAVTCHEDVEEWLQPDWTYRPATNTFAWRFLQRRPTLTLQVYRCRLEAWRLFRKHHYLSTAINPAAQAFMAVWNRRPVAFSAWVNALVKLGGRREHRTVTLPDYQGIGIGHALSSFCASLYKALGYRALSTTTHPAFIAARMKSCQWRMIRSPSLARPSGSKRFALNHARARLTAGFEYVGPAANVTLARRLLGYDGTGGAI
jgi:ABC-type molybdenum transport system ATPase subunit/photorepair protein PhrA/GNAT superfamily N-acetyltransferase